MAKTKKPFNPDDFDVELQVKDVVEKFPKILENDYTIVSLNEELTKLNYEIASQKYQDKKDKDIEAYFEFDVDYIV
jgi:hypothetical protein